MSLSVDPRTYPIVLRLKDNYLVVSQPDLGLVKATTKFDDIKSAQDIGNVVLELLRDICAKTQSLTKKLNKLPAPTQYYEMDPALMEDRITVTEASRILGISTSTLRRAIDDGFLKSLKTPKGYNRILFQDVIAYKELLNQPKNIPELKRKKMATYQVWYNMKQRCENERSQAWDYYGGRGIKVCEAWSNSFDEFLKDMGLKPDNLSIDRINNEGDYEPENCRWATAKTQRANQRRPRKKVSHEPMDSMVDLFMWGMEQEEERVLE